MDEQRISRRTFLCLGAAAAGAALAGCQTRGPAAPTAAPTAAPPAEKIKLTHWYHQYGEEGCEEAVQRYAREYEDLNPGVEIDVQWIPGDYGGKLSAALQAGQGAPDVFETQMNLDQVKAGMYAVLDDLFTDALKADFGAAMEQMSWEGTIYGVKMINDTGFLYYRKSLLDAAGVQPPTTLDELIAAAKALDKDGVKGLFIGNDGLGYQYRLALWNTGQDIVKDGKVGWTPERVAASYMKVKELYDSGALLLGAPADWWDPTALVAGLAAMQFTGLWAMPAIVKALGDDVGIVGYPKADAQGTPSTFIGGWTQFAYGKGPNIEAAKALIKWMWIDNTKLQEDWSTAYGFHIPPRASAAGAAAKLSSGLDCQ